MARSTGQVRAPVYSRSNAGGFSLTPGRAAESTYLRVGCRGDRSVEIVFGGKGANNDVNNYRLYQVRRSPAVGNQAGDETLTLYGEGSFTLGALAGVVAADMAVTDPNKRGCPCTDELIADTLSFTLATDATTRRGPAAKEEAALSSPGAQVYSPLHDEEARLVIPDTLGCDGWVIEIQMAANATHAAAWVESMS